VCLAAFFRGIINLNIAFLALIKNYFAFVFISINAVISQTIVNLVYTRSGYVVSDRYFASMALSELSIPVSIDTPCSVKAYGSTASLLFSLRFQFATLNFSIQRRKVET